MKFPRDILGKPVFSSGAAHVRAQGSVTADIIILVAANMIWGSTDVVAKFALYEMSPEALLWTRLTVGLIAFSPALWLRRREIPRSVRGLLPFAALGATGFFLNFVLQYQGLSLAPASHATALRVSEALVIVLLAVLFLGERAGGRAVAGLISGTLGVILVLDIDFKNLGLFSSGARLGDLIILAGIFVEGLYTVIGKRVLAKSSPLTTTALALVLGWVMLSVFYGARIGEELVREAPPLSALLAGAYLGLFASALGYWMYYVVLARRDSHRVGISIMIQPVIGIPLAALVFKDSMTPMFIAGAALIVVGVYLALGRGPAKNA